MNELIYGSIREKKKCLERRSIIGNDLIPEGVSSSRLDESTPAKAKEPAKSNQVEAKMNKKDEEVASKILKDIDNMDDNGKIKKTKPAEKNIFQKLKEKFFKKIPTKPLSGSEFNQTTDKSSNKLKKKYIS